MVSMSDDFISYDVSKMPDVTLNVQYVWRDERIHYKINIEKE